MPTQPDNHNADARRIICGGRIRGTAGKQTARGRNVAWQHSACDRMHLFLQLDQALLSSFQSTLTLCEPPLRAFKALSQRLCLAFSGFHLGSCGVRSSSLCGIVVCGGCRLLRGAVNRLPRGLQDRVCELRLETGAALGTDSGLRKGLISG